MNMNTYTNKETMKTPPNQNDHDRSYGLLSSITQVLTEEQYLDNNRKQQQHHQEQPDKMSRDLQWNDMGKQTKEYQVNIIEKL